MIFLKHFDTSMQSLLGVSKTYMQRNAKVGDLGPVICEKMRWTPGTPVKLYEVNFHIQTFQTVSLALFRKSSRA
jgi:hypothetical protein